MAVRGGDKKTLERLCRSITRPALAEGRVRYERRRLGTVLLYQRVAYHYPDFLAALGEIVQAEKST